MQNLLIDNAHKMGIKLNNTQTDKLLLYCTILLKWNKTYNLTSFNNIQKIISHHLLDSLSILPYIKPTTLLDIGSGAGLPGIIIAVMSSNTTVSVLDASNKKCKFMQFIKTELAINNLSVLNIRTESLSHHCFMQISARAFASIDKTIKLSKHLLCKQGCYLLMKGGNHRKEIVSYASTTIYKLKVPLVSDNRYLLKIKLIKKK